MLEAETDFEEEFLNRFSSINGTNKAWLKHGMSANELIGLVVECVPSALDDNKTGE